ncbi:hypothetical protein FZEAL_8720 [Fusarium zealandicum]|uniref:Uncharacterized protein n=1 Tax=Fusarium zealandicum TaxID=1053134 RepID=A0A8H4XHE0_9HYPO|nr:hypothetical protein FZEAL_8720 [Fusarium zealandicum]
MGCCESTQRKSGQQGNGFQDMGPRASEGHAPDATGDQASASHAGEQAQGSTVPALAAPTITGYPIIYEQPVETYGYALTTDSVSRGATAGQYHVGNTANPGGTTAKNTGTSQAHAGPGSSSSETSAGGNQRNAN